MHQELPPQVSERHHSGRAFEDILQARVSRRSALQGGLGLAAMTFFAGSGLAGCAGSDSDSHANTGNGGLPGPSSPASLSFESVPASLADKVTLPAGYSAQVIAPWGTPLLGQFPAFKTDGSNTAHDQAEQAGSHHDGMYAFPVLLRHGVLDYPSPVTNHCLLCINYEAIDTELLHGGNRKTSPAGPIDADQVRKEINAHGIGVMELIKKGRQWQLVQSGFNRRITANTPILFAGPAAGSSLLVTRFSRSGTSGRGTVNNCGCGWTPWGTYLSGEENFAGYLVSHEQPLPEAKARYGLSPTGNGLLWSNLGGDDSELNDEFSRWDTTPNAASSRDDYRYEANQFGWVVEVDPYDPAATPVKRTAMGRFGHEGTAPGKIEAGKPIAFYMGDDARGEYIYKYVTHENWDPQQASTLRQTMLDRGTLFVARFNEDGSGEWLPLEFGKVPNTPTHRWSDQADILVHTRIAADAVGATPMDRPEWASVDPHSGEIYFTLTNNNDRGQPNEEATNAANPRANNEYGHIIKLRENQDNGRARRFQWDIFVFAGPANADPDHPQACQSGLTEANQFAGPDGLYFDHRGVLWIQTDNSGNLVADATNDQLLAVIPAHLEKSPGSASIITHANQAQIKRFMVGVKGCEVTGCFLTADSKTLFVNLQHPEDGSHFPNNSQLPRSATLAITRDDGGDIAL